MAFKAYVESVQDNPAPAGNIFVTVRYEDEDTGRVIRKDLKYVAGQKLAVFEAEVLVERDALRELDTVKAELKSALGREVKAADEIAEAAGAIV